MRDKEGGALAADFQPRTLIGANNVSRNIIVTSRAMRRECLNSEHYGLRVF